MDLVPSLGTFAGAASLLLLALLALRRRKRNIRCRLHTRNMQRLALFRKDREEFHLQVQKAPIKSRKRHAGGGCEEKLASHSQPSAFE